MYLLELVSKSRAQFQLWVDKFLKWKRPVSFTQCNPLTSLKYLMLWKVAGGIWLTIWLLHLINQCETLSWFHNVDTLNFWSMRQRLCRQAPKSIVNSSQHIKICFIWKRIIMYVWYLCVWTISGWKRVRQLNYKTNVANVAESSCIFLYCMYVCFLILFT